MKLTRQISGRSRQFTVGNGGAITGHITGGTASYRGDAGSIGGTAKPKVAYVIITYHRRWPSGGMRTRRGLDRLDHAGTLPGRSGPWRAVRPAAGAGRVVGPERWG